MQGAQYYLETTTGSYHIGRKLGHGSFGKVFLSENQDKPPVVIKVFKDNKVAREELFISKEICSKNLSGLINLLDNGLVSDNSIAKKLEVALGSVFLVFNFIESSLKYV